MLVTEDDCSGRSNSENREGIDGAICAYRRKTRLSMELQRRRSCYGIRHSGYIIVFTYSLLVSMVT